MGELITGLIIGLIVGIITTIIAHRLKYKHLKKEIFYKKKVDYFERLIEFLTSQEHDLNLNIEIIKESEYGKTFEKILPSKDHLEKNLMDGLNFDINEDKSLIFFQDKRKIIELMDDFLKITNIIQDEIIKRLKRKKCDLQKIKNDFKDLKNKKNEIICLMKVELK